MDHIDPFVLAILVRSLPSLGAEEEVLSPLGPDPGPRLAASSGQDLPVLRMRLCLTWAQALQNQGRGTFLVFLQEQQHRRFIRIQPQEGAQDLDLDGLSIVERGPEGQERRCAGAWLRRGGGFALSPLNGGGLYGRLYELGAAAPASTAQLRLILTLDNTELDLGSEELSQDPALTALPRQPYPRLAELFAAWQRREMRHFEEALDSLLMDGRGLSGRPQRPAWRAWPRFHALYLRAILAELRRSQPPEWGRPIFATALQHPQLSLS